MRAIADGVAGGTGGMADRMASLFRGVAHTMANRARTLPDGMADGLGAVAEAVTYGSGTRLDGLAQAGLNVIGLRRRQAQNGHSG
jgi:hypothetical protein